MHLNLFCEFSLSCLLAFVPNLQGPGLSAVIVSDERPIAMMLEECQLEIVYQVHCKNLVFFSNMILFVW